MTPQKKDFETPQTKLLRRIISVFLKTTAMEHFPRIFTRIFPPWEDHVSDGHFFARPPTRAPRRSTGPKVFFADPHTCPPGAVTFSGDLFKNFFNEKFLKRSPEKVTAAGGQVWGSAKKTFGPVDRRGAVVGGRPKKCPSETCSSHGGKILVKILFETPPHSPVQKLILKLATPAFRLSESNRTTTKNVS